MAELPAPGSEAWHREQADFHLGKADQLSRERQDEEAFQFNVKIWTEIKTWDPDKKVFVSQTPEGEYTQTVDEAVALYDPHRGARIIEFLETYRDE